MSHLEGDILPDGDRTATLWKGIFIFSNHEKVKSKVKPGMATKMITCLADPRERPLIWVKYH